mmetsp:Transcript_6351/g.22703  ORF Transcript_6351/g.22703 Transcript_6351/m.22703 type:complete len:226 (-) Transcript_6351:817-1494(-)
MRITIPLSSSPLLPALPLIWMYSPEESHRNPPPSNFLGLTNTTVLAGMLSPVEKVSVAKRHLSRPSWKRTSTTSFRMGRSPEWCTPIPCLSSGRRWLICGSLRSSGLRHSTAFAKMVLVSFFSSSVVRSRLVSLVARFSQSLFEKAKMMQGSNRLSIMSCTIFRMSSWFLFFFSLRSSSPSPSLAPSAATAFWKLSGLNFDFSSTTMYSPLDPAGNMKCCSGVGR